MKNVTPGRQPRVHIPPYIDSAAYMQGRFDLSLEIAETNYWRGRGYRIDPLSGKLLPLPDRMSP